MVSQSPLVRVVTATRCAESDFTNTCALGQSLLRLQHDKRVRLAVAFENKTGLSEIFNRAIALTGDDEPDVLIFCHDEVRIDDIYFVDHVLAGLETYDVLGVAGAKKTSAEQLVWAGTVKNKDPSTFVSLIAEGHLSGAVGSLHGGILG